MSWSKIYCIVLAGLLIATTTSADVIPFFGRRKPPMRSWIEFRVDQLPKGTAILFLDEYGSLLSKAPEQLIIRMYGPGTVYGANEKQLSKPFSFNIDSEKLVLLRVVSQHDIPHSDGVPPQPRVLNCSMTKNKILKFELNCTE